MITYHSQLLQPLSLISRYSKNSKDTSSAFWESTGSNVPAVAENTRVSLAVLWGNVTLKVDVTVTHKKSTIYIFL